VLQTTFPFKIRGETMRHAGEQPDIPQGRTRFLLKQTSELIRKIVARNATWIPHIVASGKSQVFSGRISWTRKTLFNCLWTSIRRIVIHNDCFDREICLGLADGFETIAEIVSSVPMTIMIGCQHRCFLRLSGLLRGLESWAVDKEGT
jgi:hypothetical protein